MAVVAMHRDNNVLPGCAEAFTNAISLAQNKKEFFNKVSIELEKYGFDLSSMEEIELFDLRKNRCQLDQELLEIAEEASMKGTVEFTTFHGYEGN